MSMGWVSLGLIVWDSSLPWFTYTTWNCLNYSILSWLLHIAIMGLHACLSCLRLFSSHNEISGPMFGFSITHLWLFLLLLFYKNFEFASSYCEHLELDIFDSWPWFLVSVLWCAQFSYNSKYRIAFVWCNNKICDKWELFSFLFIRPSYIENIESLSRLGNNEHGQAGVELDQANVD